jgi:hypothetical protein
VIDVPKAKDMGKNERSSSVTKKMKDKWREERNTYKGHGE